MSSLNAHLLPPLFDLSTPSIQHELHDLLHKGFTYFGNSTCPFSRRALWSAVENGIDFKDRYIHVTLGEAKPSWFKARVNSAGLLPQRMGLV